MTWACVSNTKRENPAFFDYFLCSLMLELELLWQAGDGYCDVTWRESWREFNEVRWKKGKVKTFIMIARESSLTITAALAKKIIVFRSDNICTVLGKKDCKLLCIIVYFHNLKRVPR